MVYLEDPGVGRASREATSSCRGHKAADCDGGRCAIVSIYLVSSCVPSYIDINESICLEYLAVNVSLHHAASARMSSKNMGNRDPRTLRKHG